MFSQRLERALALVWLVCVLLMAVHLTTTLRRGVHIETDILKLLPETDQSPLLKKAFESVAGNVSRQLVFLIGHPEPADAEKAAEQLAQSLESHASVTNVVLKVSTSDKEAGFYQWAFPCREVLLREDDLLALGQEGGAAAFLAQSEKFLYSPFASAFSYILEEDPLLLFASYLKGLPEAPGLMSVKNGYMTAESDEGTVILLRAQAVESSFSRTQQRRLIADIDQAQTALAQQFPKVSVARTGMMFFAYHGANRAEQEAGFISTGSIIAVILLMLWVFRSPGQLIVMLLPVAVGFLTSFALSFLIFPSLHAITLGFGASMIGICVDYSFHYFSEQLAAKEEGPVLARIFPGITLGMITSVMAYVGLLLAPFPGLRQMAVFSGIGLLAAYLTVVCWFPFLARVKSTSRTPVVLKLSGAYVDCIARHMTGKGRVALIVGLTGLSLLGISRLTFNDDIRLLQPPSEGLLQQEQHIRSYLGGVDGGRFFIVEGETPQEVLENEEELVGHLEALKAEGALAYASAITDVVPSLSRQHQSRAALRNAFGSDDGTLQAYMRRLGFSGVAIEKKEARLKQAGLLQLEDALANPALSDLSAFWLGEVAGRYASMVLLGGIEDMADMAKLDASLEAAHFVDKIGEVSGVLQTLRKKSISLLLLAYLLIGGFLWLRYGGRRSLLIYVPPVLAGMLSIAMAGFMGEPANIFHCFGVLLVLGMGIDYTLFFAEARSHVRPVMMAVLLSAITTMLGFGLLSFSSTPAIRGFGQTILWGIAWAMLLSPLAVTQGVKRGGDDG